jgi:predicted MFS family arabinose efflux permease
MTRSRLPAWLARLDRISLIVGFGTTLGLASQSAAPWVLGALVQSGGFSATSASLVVTVELIASGVTTALLAPIVHRIPHKRTLVLATLLLIAAQVASMLVTDAPVLFAARVLSGMGYGAVFAIATAAGVAAANPAAAYATAGSLSLLLGTCLNPMLGYGSQYHAAPGVFAGLLAYSLLLALPLFAMRFDTERPRAARESGAPAAPLRPGRVAIALAIIGLFAIATNGTYVFVERIAAHVGLGGTTLGNGLAVVSLLGSVGGIAAAALNTRIGNVMPFVGGMAAMALSTALLIGAWQPMIFWIGFTAWVGVYWFVYPYILALAAAIDPSGRAATATGSGLVLFGAVGSALAGWMSDHGGLGLYRLVALALFGLAALIGAALWLRVEREQKPGAP